MYAIALLLALCFLLRPIPALASDVDKGCPSGHSPVRFVLPPVFEAAGSFSEGLAPVKKDGKWGFINPEGRFIIPPQFENAGTFRDGLACVAQLGRLGLINQGGAFVISPQYDYIGLRIKGIARFGIYADDSPDRSKARPYSAPLKYGFLSTEGSGRELLPAQYLDAGNFIDGRAFVLFHEEPDLWKIIDLSGNVLASPLPPVSQFYPHFGEWGNDGPMAFISTRDFEEARKGRTEWEQEAPVGFVSAAGEVVIPPRRGLIFSGFRNGRVACKTENGLWGCLDESGKEVISAQSLIPVSFYNGYALIVMGENQEALWNHTAVYAYKKPDGVLLYPESFTGRSLPGPHEPSEILPVRYKDKGGFITMDGKWAIPPVFHSAWEFSEGLCVFSIVTDYPEALRAVGTQGMLQGYINTSGDIVIPARYFNAQPFSGGDARVGTAMPETPESQIWIDRKGRPLPPEILEIAEPAEGFIPARTTEGWGYLPTVALE